MGNRIANFRTAIFQRCIDWSETLQFYCAEKEWHTLEGFFNNLGWRFLTWGSK